MKTLSALAAPASLLGGFLVAASQYLVWFHAPVERTLGPVQKIFYLHVPLAWWALISFFVVFVCGAAYLVRRDMRYDRLAGAACEVGVVFAGLALISGSVWARASWNVWWTWDPRLTTTLVMWFVYAAYLVVRCMDLPPARRAMVSAVLGVVAFADVPLVFLSARMWRSIHPSVFANKGGGLTPEMLTTLLVCLGAWAFLWLGLFTLRAGGLEAAQRLESLRLAATDKDT